MSSSPDSVPIDVGIAKQVHESWRQWAIASNAPTMPYPAKDKCLPTCPVERILLTVYEVEEGAEPVSLAHAGYHACSKYCTVRGNSGLHARPGTIPGSRLRGSVYWCVRHARMHACGPWCDQTHRDNIGRAVCALSGNSLGTACLASYTDGALVSDIVLDDTGTASAVSAAATSDARQRAAASSNQSTFSRRASSHLVESGAVPESPDQPQRGLFGDLMSDNTFQDGAGTWLDERYAEAFVVVDHILFSDERARIERARYWHIYSDAKKRALAYVRRELRAKRPVYLNVCQDIFQTELRRRRLYPTLLVPDKAVHRLVAARTLIILEFYVQLQQAVSLVPAKKFARRSAEAIKRLFQYQFVHVVPMILQLMREGVIWDGVRVLPEDWVVKAYCPLPAVLVELEYDKRSCTAIRKDLVDVMSALQSQGVTAAHLECTTLDSTFVMHGTDSVVDAFLTARLQRGVV